MKRRAASGFTLLELIVVVLVIVLVLSLSYPLLSRGSSSVQLRSAGRDVLNIFRYAREKAVTEQVGMRVTVDREKQRLVVSDDLGDRGRFYLMPKDVVIERIRLGGMEVSAGAMEIRFLPNGSSEAGDLLLKSRAGSYLRVLCDPLAGGARIETGRGEEIP